MSHRSSTFLALGLTNLNENELFDGPWLIFENMAHENFYKLWCLYLEFSKEIVGQVTKPIKNFDSKNRSFTDLNRHRTVHVRLRSSADGWIRTISARIFGIGRRLRRGVGRWSLYFWPLEWFSFEFSQWLAEKGWNKIHFDWVIAWLLTFSLFR